MEGDPPMVHFDKGAFKCFFQKRVMFVVILMGYSMLFSGEISVALAQHPQKLSEKGPTLDPKGGMLQFGIFSPSAASHKFCP